MTYPKPLITEKTLNLTQSMWFTFTCPKELTKTDIAEYIESKYGAKPLAVTITKRISRNRRRGRHMFKTQAKKIFRVKMPEKSKIPGFEIQTDKK